jgi:hypothetical protein
MAATISFWAGADIAVVDMAGSGLGFYGDAGFGASVQVGQWQGRTFITNANGTAQGPEVDNTKYLNPTGVILGQSGSGLKLNQIPNYLATLNVRFTNDTAVKVQNATFRIYDRVDPTHPATGVTTAVYEVNHQGSGQTADGSGGPGTPVVGGNHAWYMFPATGASPMPITASPGTSGLSPSGSNTVDTRHDWYFALSASPDSTGSKTQYGAYVSLEFL